MTADNGASAVLLPAPPNSYVQGVRAYPSACRALHLQPFSAVNVFNRCRERNRDASADEFSQGIRDDGHIVRSRSRVGGARGVATNNARKRANHDRMVKSCSFRSKSCRDCGKSFFAPPDATTQGAPLQFTARTRRFTHEVPFTRSLIAIHPLSFLPLSTLSFPKFFQKNFDIPLPFI